MPIHMDSLCMATPFIGMIRLACLQFLLNFAAIDDLHLREPTLLKEAFRSLRIPHRETRRTILIVHPRVTRLALVHVRCTMRPICFSYLLLEFMRPVGSYKVEPQQMPGRCPTEPDTRHILRFHRNVLLVGGVSLRLRVFVPEPSTFVCIAGNARSLLRRPYTLPGTEPPPHPRPLLPSSPKLTGGPLCWSRFFNSPTCSD